jgi:hypothetical protein
MRCLILSLLIVLVFGSCSSYEYLTLSSPQIPKNDKKEFSWENDTMKLVYNFHGEGGPMSVTIYNKTEKPLFVNWKKSALIRDGHSTSLFNSSVQVTGELSTTAIPLRSKVATASYSSLSASFDLPQGMELIPPASDIKKGLFAVQDEAVLNAQNKDTAHSEKITDAYGVVARFKRFSFEEAQSPLQFRSYLTFVLGNDNSPEFSVQHSFYAKEVLLSSDDPEYFSLYRQGGDNLYIKQPAQ